MPKHNSHGPRKNRNCNKKQKDYNLAVTSTHVNCNEPTLIGPPPTSTPSTQPPLIGPPPTSIPSTQPSLIESPPTSIPSTTQPSLIESPSTTQSGY